MPTPTVSGDMERSIAEHERACLVLIENEQERIAPDNHLISTLCDSVRLAREYVDFMRAPLAVRTGAPIRDLVGNQLVVSITTDSTLNPFPPIHCVRCGETWPQEMPRACHCFRWPNKGTVSLPVAPAVPEPVKEWTISFDELDRLGSYPFSGWFERIACAPEGVARAFIAKHRLDTDNYRKLNYSLDHGLTWICAGCNEKECKCQR